MVHREVSSADVYEGIQSMDQKNKIRYSRQTVLPEVGESGQNRLSNSSVAVVGAGALGNPAILYLAAAGIGEIRVFDPDKIGLSNLHRQIIYDTTQVGMSKMEGISEKIKKMNPNINLQLYEESISVENIDLLEECDFIVEATDSMSTKFLVSDFCVKKQIPYCIAGIWTFEAQISSYLPGTACYRCIHRDLPKDNPLPPCEVSGILGAVTGCIGSLQALEAIKYILGLHDSLLINKILVCDLLASTFTKVIVQKSTECKACTSSEDLLYSYNYARDW